MKKRLLPLVLLFSSLLGCSNINAKYSIKSMNYLDTIENEGVVPTPITSEQISIKMDTKSTFMVFFYSTGCGSCEAFKANVIRYQKEKKTLIYYYDCEGILDTLISLQPSLEGKIDYPCLLLFRNGNVVYTVSKQKLENYSTLKSVLSKHHSPSKTSYCVTNDALTNYLESTTESYVITYDSKNKSNSEYINSYISKNEKNTLILDKNSLDETIYTTLKTFFDVGVFSETTCGYFNKENQEKSVIDYGL